MKTGKDKRIAITVKKSTFAKKQETGHQFHTEARWVPKNHKIFEAKPARKNQMVSTLEIIRENRGERDS